MIRHVQLGQVAGASLSRESVSIERITVQNFSDASTQLWLGVYTTTLNDAGVATAPTAGQVPVVEGALVSAWESAELFNGMSPQVAGPVYIALSSTENSYTATAITARIDIDYDSVEDVPTALVTTTTASGNKLAVWNNASAPNALYDLFVGDLNGNGGVPLYIQLFALDTGSVVNGVTPLAQWPMSLVAGTLGFNTPTAGESYLNFGRTATSGELPAGGLTTFSQNALISTAQAQFAGANSYQGCTIAISTTSGVLTLAAAASAEITARYTPNS